MQTVPGPLANAPDAPHPAAGFAAALDVILVSILALLGARFREIGAFTGPLWTRFSRARVRLTRLLTALSAGTWRPSRPRAPQNGQKGGARPPYSPHGKLWLVRKLGYHAAGYGSQLQFLLQDPATQSLLANAPPQALNALGRTLRPLCHLLGVDLPPALLPAPRMRPKPERASKPRQPKPPKPQLPPLLPLYPQRRPRPLPFLNFAKKPHPA